MTKSPTAIAHETVAFGRNNIYWRPTDKEALALASSYLELEKALERLVKVCDKRALDDSLAALAKARGEAP